MLPKYAGRRATSSPDMTIPFKKSSALFYTRFRQSRTGFFVAKALDG
jgi:hypothetical protein